MRFLKQPQFLAILHLTIFYAKLPQFGGAMAGRQSAAVEKALSAYKTAKRRSPFPDIYRIAKKYGIAASSLYRAIKDSS